MVVAVVTDLNLLKTQLVQDPIPNLLVLGDDGRGFHDSPVGDDEHILGGLLCNLEIHVLKVES